MRLIGWFFEIWKKGVLLMIGALFLGGLVWKFWDDIRDLFIKLPKPWFVESPWVNGGLYVLLGPFVAGVLLWLINQGLRYLVLGGEDQEAIIYDDDTRAVGALVILGKIIRIRGVQYYIYIRPHLLSILTGNIGVVRKDDNPRLGLKDTNRSGKECLASHAVRASDMPDELPVKP